MRNEYLKYDESPDRYKFIALKLHSFYFSLYTSIDINQRSALAMNSILISKWKICYKIILHNYVLDQTNAYHCPLLIFYWIDFSFPDWF